MDILNRRGTFSTKGLVATSKNYDFVIGGGNRGGRGPMVPLKFKVSP